MKVFYVNVTVLDASAAVYNKIHTTLSRNLPGTADFKAAVASRVAEKASQAVSPKMVTKMLSEKMKELLVRFHAPECQFTRTGL